MPEALEEFLVVLAYSTKTQLAVMFGLAFFTGTLTAGDYFASHLELHDPPAPLNEMFREKIAHRYDKAAWATLGSFFLLAAKCYKRDKNGYFDFNIYFGNSCQRHEIRILIKAQPRNRRMRTELMTEAICWDLSSKITAEYALANKDFGYFCPHPICLQEVRPKKIRNAHFFAPGNHVASCPNEPEKVEGKGTGTTPAKRESIVPPPAIPTELGPAKSRIGKKRKPTIKELLALANSLQAMPPVCAGTLQEVVSAWLQMPEEQRPTKRLRINNAELSYESALYCLRYFGDNPIEQLSSDTRIVYGAARLDIKDDCYWIKSVKAITAGERKLNLVIRVTRNNSLADQYIANLLAASPISTSFTLFYFGDLPKLSRSGKSYVVSDDISDDYRRFVVVSA